MSETYHPVLEAALPIDDGRMVVVANTLPGRIKNGELVHSAGGLVTAMEPLVRGRDALWIGIHTETDEREGLAEALRSGSAQKRVELKTAGVSDAIFDKHYKGWANDTVWGPFHGMLDKMRYQPEYWEASEIATKELAKTVLLHTEEGDRTLVNDYHLIRTAKHMRDMGSTQRISFFLHTPFAAPDIFTQIPHHEELVEGFLAYDEVGVHTKKDRDKLLQTIARVMPHAPIVSESDGSFRVVTPERTTRFVANLISIDPYEFRRQADSDEAMEEAKKIRAGYPEGVVIAHEASRTDYTKGILERLQALDILFDKHPDMKGSFTQILTLAQARTGIPAYDELVDQVNAGIEALNEKYGRKGWSPVVRTPLLDRIPLVGHYRAVDGSVVGPVADGCNLSFLEGLAAGKDVRFNGISEHAGVAELMKEAVIFDAKDPHNYAKAYETMLRMSDEDKKAQTQTLRGRLYSHTIFDWADVVNQGFAKMRR